MSEIESLRQQVADLQARVTMLEEAMLAVKPVFEDLRRGLDAADAVRRLASDSLHGRLIR